MKALYDHETESEDDSEPQTKAYYEAVDNKTMSLNTQHKTKQQANQPSGEDDYIEAKKHALWYGGADRIHYAATITPKYRPAVRLKSISTDRVESTPETVRKSQKQFVAESPPSLPPFVQ